MRRDSYGDNTFFIHATCLPYIIHHMASITQQRQCARSSGTNVLVLEQIRDNFLSPSQPLWNGRQRKCRYRTSSKLKLCCGNQPCHERDHSSWWDHSLRWGISLVSLTKTRVIISTPLSFADIRFTACCSVLQSVVVCCSVLQCVVVCCSVLQCVAVCCSVLQCVAV